MVAHREFPGSHRIVRSTSNSRCKRWSTMTLKHRILSRRKLTASIAAGVAAIALASGGYAIANSGPSGSANAATAGKVVPFHRGQPSPATQVGQVPANFTPGTGKLVTGTAANR